MSCSEPRKRMSFSSTPRSSSTPRDSSSRTEEGTFAAPLVRYAQITRRPALRSRVMRAAIPYSSSWCANTQSKSDMIGRRPRQRPALLQIDLRVERLREQAKAMRTGDESASQQRGEVRMLFRNQRRREVHAAFPGVCDRVMHQRAQRARIAAEFDQAMRVDAFQDAVAADEMCAAVFAPRVLPDRRVVVVAC